MVAANACDYRADGRVAEHGVDIVGTFLWSAGDVARHAERVWRGADAVAQPLKIRTATFPTVRERAQRPERRTDDTDGVAAAQRARLDEWQHRTRSWPRTRERGRSRIPVRNLRPARVCGGDKSLLAGGLSVALGDGIP